MGSQAKSTSWPHMQDINKIASQLCIPSPLLEASSDKVKVTLLWIVHIQACKWTYEVFPCLTECYIYTYTLIVEMYVVCCKQKFSYVNRHKASAIRISICQTLENAANTVRAKWSCRCNISLCYHAAVGESLRYANSGDCTIRVGSQSSNQSEACLRNSWLLRFRRTQEVLPN